MADLELHYTSNDGRELDFEPKVTWDDLDEFFEEECEGTYIGSLATKFIDLDKLFEDEDFIKWAHEHWKVQAMDEFKKIKDQEDEDHKAELDYAVDQINFKIDDDGYTEDNLDTLIEITAERQGLDPQELKQYYENRK